MLKVKNSLMTSYRFRTRFISIESQPKKIVIVVVVVIGVVVVVVHVVVVVILLLIPETYL